MPTPDESRQDGAALGTAEPPTRNPLLSEETSSDNFDLGDFEFAFEEGTGELVADRPADREPAAESGPEDEAARLIAESESGGDDAENLKARLKGLQRETTPVFQERAELRRKLAEMEKRLARFEETDDERRYEADQAAEAESLQSAITEAVREAAGDDGLLDGAALTKVLARVLPEAVQRSAKASNEKFKRLEAVEAQLAQAREANQLLVQYGPKLPIMAQVLRERLAEDPSLQEKYTPAELLQQVHDDLAELARQELAKRQKDAEPADPDASEAARRKARANATDPDGISPGPGAPELPASRPRNLDEAVAMSFKQSGFA